MFKKLILIVFFICFVFVSNNVLAEEQEISPVSISIHLVIASGATSLYDSEISVTACDSDNNQDTRDTITAYCAILESGLASDWNWDWAPGAYVNSIGNIAGYTSQDSSGDDVYHYWSWSLNGEYAELGLNQYELQLNDLISLNFIDPIEEPETEEKPKERSSSRGGSYIGFSDESINNETKTFSFDRAISFLIENQNFDGSFSSDMYTDWVAIGVSKQEGGEVLKEKIYNYLINQNFSSEIISDYERRAMTLMALNIDPYLGTKINYIKKITDSFDGEQIGDKSLYNDDIFGLIVLSKAGFVYEDKIISKTIDLILSKQQSDGSWGSIDLTGAVIQSLSNYKDIEKISKSIDKAKEYLVNEQNKDGSFDNVFSTSWVAQSLLDDNFYNENIERSIEYLKNLQGDDGAIGEGDIESKVWATSYALPAINKLSWNDILVSFSKLQAPLDVQKSDSQVLQNYSEKKINTEIVKKEVSKEKKEILDNNLTAGVANAEIIKKPWGKIIFNTVESIFSWLSIKIGF